LLMATVRFALVGVCYISEEHARLSGPPHRIMWMDGFRFGNSEHIVPEADPRVIPWQWTSSIVTIGTASNDSVLERCKLRKIRVRGIPNVNITCGRDVIYCQQHIWQKIGYILLHHYSTYILLYFTKQVYRQSNIHSSIASDKLVSC